MTMTYEICDRCKANVPEGAGAVVLKRTNCVGAEVKVYPTMNLCDTCFDEVFKNGVATGKQEGVDK